MCDRCDRKVVVKQWGLWVGIFLTFAIFVASQIFIYGQVTGEIKSHIKNAPTYERISESYVTKSEFQTMKEMIFYLYKKEGGN